MFRPSKTMKYISLILIILLVVGCGSQSGDKERLTPTDKELLTSFEMDALNEHKAILTAEIKTPFIAHVFGNTLKRFEQAEAPEGRSKVRLIGALSDGFKSTVKNIWSKLKEAGFSGYDVSKLDDNELIRFQQSTSFPAPLSAARNNPKGALPHNLVQLLVHGTEYFNGERDIISKIIIPSKKLGFSRALLGLNIERKTFLAVPKISKEEEFIFANASDEALDYALVDPLTEPDILFLKKRPDNLILVTEAQIAAWNTIITEGFKADAFFGQYFNGEALSNSSSSPLSAAVRQGSTGLNTSLLNLNGFQGTQTPLGLPIYVEFKGVFDDVKATHDLQGSIAYNYHNVTFGVIQTYAKNINSLGLTENHWETALAGSYSLNNLFLEGQVGSILANSHYNKDLVGFRSQLTIGYDFKHISPFIQYIHRSFTDKADHAVYAGVEVNLTEHITESYTLKTQWLFRAGQNSIKGLLTSAEWMTSLDINNGISFAAALCMNEISENARVQICLTQ